MDEMLILTKPSGQTCPRGWSKVRPKAVWCPTRGLLRSRGHKWFVKHGPTQRAKRGTWIRFMSDKYILISVFTVANVDGDASPISRWKFISAGAAERDSGHAAIALRWVVTRKCTVAAVVKSGLRQREAKEGDTINTSILDNTCALFTLF